MTLLPSSEAPFGFLEPYRQTILSNSHPLTWANWWMLFMLPLVPLYGQALLLRYEGTRLWRVALAGLGIGLLWDAGFKYRFDQPWFNALNNGIGIAILHLTVRYLEFGLLEGPIYDRYYAEKYKRNFLISALDICINARWIGLGAIDLDHNGRIKASSHNGHALGEDNIFDGKIDDDVPDGGVETQGHFVPSIKAESRQREAWLPWVNTNPPRTRIQAVIRHVIIGFVSYATFDTLLSLIRHFGIDTIASLSPTPNGLYRFTHENTFILFPRLSSYGMAIRPPPIVVEYVTAVSVATGVWLGINMGYHLFAGIAVSSGLWETESWEVDMFDRPLMADSLLDFWGRRWHQFFRHHFILVSTLLLRSLGLESRSSTIALLSFFFSGCMHALGQFTMNPVPSLTPLCLFFVISGIGCSLEVTFKRVTGRKVHGIWGRIWVWSFMLISGKMAVIAWLEAGVGGCYLSPEWAGKYLKDLVVYYLVDKA